MLYVVEIKTSYLVQYLQLSPRGINATNGETREYRPNTDATQYRANTMYTGGETTPTIVT